MENIVARVTNARVMRNVALAAAMLVLCVSPDWAQRDRGGQRGGGGQRSAQAPRAAQPRNEGRNFGPQMRQAPRQENRPQFRPAPQPQTRNEGNFQQRGPQNNFAPSSRPGMNGAQQPYNGATPQTYGNRQPFGGNQPGANQTYNGNRQTFTDAQPNNYGTRRPNNGVHLAGLAESQPECAAARPGEAVTQRSQLQASAAGRSTTADAATALR